MKPLYLIATIRPRPDRVDEARAALHALMAASLSEDGCELYDLVADSESSSTWLMLEKWTTRAHWDAHMLTEHNVAFGKLAGELLAEPTTLAFFDPA